MAEPTERTSITASDGGGLKDLGDLCENVENQAREGKYAAKDGDEQAAVDKIEQLLDEASRLRLAYRQYLARGRRSISVADHRMSV